MRYLRASGGRPSGNLTIQRGVDHEKNCQDRTGSGRSVAISHRALHRHTCIRSMNDRGRHDWLIALAWSARSAG